MAGELCVREKLAVRIGRANKGDEIPVKI